MRKRPKLRPRKKLPKKKLQRRKSPMMTMTVQMIPTKKMNPLPKSPRTKKKKKWKSMMRKMKTNQCKSKVTRTKVLKVLLDEAGVVVAIAEEVCKFLFQLYFFPNHLKLFRVLIMEEVENLDLIIYMLKIFRSWRGPWKR